ncbi:MULTISPECIES: DsbA family protein [Kitasatospora]|uniref:Thioredoxin domain-containing protein n=1 Tax=Kitasatospora cathayae TaxID=3004092 RepID=A0ABY7QC48_9ACTN|nr:thioredoxin domain-containing protein [Kitasatospora sp. HUAS 3-15]WBP90211.1 thioredoxin domain-containing protein [Kitasatospora sp. HUAS 3-15]
MSNTRKTDQKPNATERMRTARAQAERSDRIRRRVVVAAASGTVLALAAGVAFAVGGSSGSSADTAANGPLVVPANAGGTDGTVITYGKADAPHTLEVYEDFRCPFCEQLETTTGKTIQQLADDGTYKIEYHLATFLDKNLGGKGSRTALAAAGAALNEGVDKFRAFHDVLYANQPDERSDAFGDVNHILDLAGQVPGLKTDGFVKAVQEGTYAPWAAKVNDEFNKSDVTGTPTVKLDGKKLDVLTNGKAASPDEFTALVKQVTG